MAFFALLHYIRDQTYDMKNLIRTGLLCLTMVGSTVILDSCASKKEMSKGPTNPFVPTNTKEEKIIKDGNPALMSATFVGEAAFISGDTLHVRLSYNGGCGFNNFYLQSTGSDATSITYQLYRSSDDWCKDPKTADRYYLLPKEEVQGKKVNVKTARKKLL